ncbi:MAG: hypothetical protein QNJ98_05965 [Planctomycetota bacterium]|nr:hypothetical protein [Planctomycetota bacterium]
MPSYTHHFEVAAVLSTSLEKWAEQVELREQVAAELTEMAPACARTRDALEEAQRRLNKLFATPPGPRWQAAYHALGTSLRDLHERWMDAESVLRRLHPEPPELGTPGEQTVDV